MEPAPIPNALLAAQAQAAPAPAGSGFAAQVAPPVAPSDPILAMIERAARDPAVDVDKFERLMRMRRELEQDQARRAYNAALSTAKGEIEPIIKRREVEYESERTGARTSYRYEEFADVTKVVDPVFERHGLSYRFKTSQQGQRVRVTPVISHADGWSEEATPLEAELDTSGRKNPLQSLGSALTYLQRYSLRAALGLAAGRDDDGGKGGGDLVVMVDADQVAHIEQGLRDTESKLDDFLKAIHAVSVAEMTVTQYKRAVELIEQKKARLNKDSGQGSSVGSGP